MICTVVFTRIIESTVSLKRITAKYNQEEHAEAEQEGREENLLPPITCHMLRHTFCTRMILGGIDLKTVQIIMGHADAETTMRVYANVTKAQSQNEMMRMEGKDEAEVELCNSNPV